MANLKKIAERGYNSYFHFTINALPRIFESNVVETSTAIGTLKDIGRMISIDLKADYLAAFQSGRLITKGRSIKIGKTMCLAEASVFDGNDKWLAHGISKMMVTKSMQTMKNVTDYLNELHLPPKFI